MSLNLYYVGILWGIFLIDTFLPFLQLSQFGIRPRSLEGFIGVFCAPFLHASFGHIIANSIPLIVLPIIAQMATSQKVIAQVMILGGLGSGLGTWIFGSSNIHIGASGVVFALLGYLLTRAFFRPGVMWILVSVIVFIAYGGILLSLFTYKPYISWAGHFWGFVSGLLIAKHAMVDGD